MDAVNRNWQPGDVAVATLHDGTTSRAIRRNDGTWRAADSCINNPPHNFRPLVVIDPEDREQVERLVTLVRDQIRFGVVEEYEDRLQAALRSLITPPRPEEPTGLGAVVEDVNGRRWIHIDTHRDCNDDWVPLGVKTRTLLGQAAPRHRFDGIQAARVLHEGWSE